MKISSVEQMRELDRTAIEQYGIPEVVLMENAGLSAVSLLKSKITDLQKKSILVICGSGNNGGDGLVVARQLHSLGASVNILLLASPDHFYGSAAENIEIIKKMQLPLQVVTTVTDIEYLLRSSNLIIDAIFGTGLSRPVEGRYAHMIQMINQSDLPVLSLDIPSGVNGNTGEIMGTAIKADWTITFGLPKLGNLLYPGYLHNGELYVNHISFPVELYNSEHIRCSINPFTVLPSRREDGHKGTFGKALFIAGAANYLGAPYFSALSFLKAGGGYSRLASPRSITPFIANKGSEIVFHPQPETPDGSLTLQSLDSLLALSQEVDFVVLGPGLSLNDETQELARRLISKIEKPLLIDGDGLTALKSDLDLLKNRAQPTLLTPHPGEMARLLNWSADSASSIGIENIKKLSAEFGVFLVFKGAHTIITTPDGKVYLNMTGNSGMATAGSGDVLTGTIAAMYGLGMQFEHAVHNGVFLHGLSGDLAAEQIGQDGMTAQDILNHLPEAVKLLRNGQFIQKFPHYQGAIPI